MCTSDDNYDSMRLWTDSFWSMEQLPDLQNHAMAKWPPLWPYSSATVAPKDIFEPRTACNIPSTETRQSVEINPTGSDGWRPGSSDSLLTSGQQQAEQLPPEVSDMRTHVHVKHSHNSIDDLVGSPAPHRARYPKNRFMCTFPGCIDKHTGQPKRFRRVEHQKRHATTVHGKETCLLYECGVQGCKSKPFTRKDNLKSHLISVHRLDRSVGLGDYVRSKLPQPGR